MKTKPYALVICGPTSSGKTSLAFEIAKELPGCSIISADSRQSYRDLSILTGKDIPSPLPENIKFFGTDLIPADYSQNISDFSKNIRRVISSEVEKGRFVIIVGGSGLYLKSLTEYIPHSTIPQNKQLREKIEKLSVGELQQLLSRIDSKTFKGLNNSDVNNPRRLIRKIEIAQSSELPSSQNMPNITFHWVGLSLQKSLLEKKIRERVLDRLNHGVVDEVKSLHKKYPDESLPIYSSIGAREIQKYIQKEIGFEELIETWVRRELDYARRQVVWFKKQPGIIWYDESTDRGALASSLAKKIYDQNTQKEKDLS